jgi:hypothetical protein
VNAPSLPLTAVDEDRLAKAEREREALRSRWPDEFRDGARCGLLREFPGDRECGGYLRGFHQWPLERRNSWYAGFTLGCHQRKTR